VADGTPRDCPTPGCGAEADTSIIRQNEIQSGKASPLGRTVGSGPVDAATIVSSFMGGGANANSSSSSTEASAAAAPAATSPKKASKGGAAAAAARRGLLGGLLGGGAGAGTKSTAAAEKNVAATAGQGATSGLPTCADDGTIEMVFHQVILIIPFHTAE
jgi:hypothetical protein